MTLCSSGQLNLFQVFITISGLINNIFSLVLIQFLWREKKACAELVKQNPKFLWTSENSETLIKLSKSSLPPTHKTSLEKKDISSNIKIPNFQTFQKLLSIDTRIRILMVTPCGFPFSASGATWTVSVFNTQLLFFPTLDWGCFHRGIWSKI